MVMDPNKAEEHVLRSLQQALAKKKEGNVKDYARVLKALEASPPATLVFWFRSLVKCITLIEPSCYELVQLLLRYRFNGGESANAAFEKMILSLMSCNQQFTVMICEKLAVDLIPPKPEEGFELQESDLIGHYAEGIAIRLVASIPTATSFLMESLIKHFPSKVLDQLVIDQYTMHLLSIAENCRVMRDRIIEFIIRQSIDIDAEISIPEMEEDHDDLVFALDESASEISKNNSRALEMAEKLDNIMTRTFQFLEQQMNESQRAEEIFKILVKAFDSAILPTQKVKHTQFLLFFACSKSQMFSQNFLAYLIQKTIDANSPLIKETTIGYIASFIARAKFVPQSAIHSTITTLCAWVTLYMKENREFCEEYSKHSIFYHICQAIFYIFCFRIENLLDRMTKEEILNTYNIIPIIECPLNPFRFCSPFVVKELADISNDMGITRLANTCRNVLERNSRIVSPTRHIEGDFPFDPYLLKSSSQWIDDCYSSWEERNEGFEESYSEDITDPCSSVPDDYDMMMSFTPDASFDIGMHFSRSPMF